MGFEETQAETHLFDERVIVDFDVYVDGSVREGLKDLGEEGDAGVCPPLTETLCREKAQKLKP